jgi:PDZ domain
MHYCCFVMYPEQIIRRYGELEGEIHAIELQRDPFAATLGLDLAGNASLETMSVFVVNIHPDSIAARDGRIRIGDQLLEVQ